MMNSEVEKHPFQLRCITYLVPSIPVEFFETLVHLFEEKLGIPTSLIYESRGNGGPLADHEDPFKSDWAHVGFMSSSGYLRMKEEKWMSVELLPVSSVHIHKKKLTIPGVLVDVIVHSDTRDRIKEFMDLRGCKWAYTYSTSISSSILATYKLKQLGETSNFFGDHLVSGSHVNSINMVLMKQAEASAVDANALANWAAHNPRLATEISVVDTWGPTPPYAIVVSKSLPGELKSKLTEVLLNLHNDKKWTEKLNSFFVSHFLPIGDHVFTFEKDIASLVKDQGIDQRIYY
ncbi:unnamed protein product [Darwinula stevensoni]|uniref:Uncharacterized protein n=1 Tax=Darwinula stevensoni TaxID=69355 RepID=A0A7R8X604_9CRUS|nr:unnamed protein product [Darwinula stevensoni]CAG0885216.1 unnamed protein product [Darwinula stevensoni]